MLRFFASVAALLGMMCGVVQARVIQHDLNVTITPSSHAIKVLDSITLPAGQHRFLLHAGLSVKAVQGQVQAIDDGENSSANIPVPFRSYYATPDEQGRLSLEYEGEIYQPSNNGSSSTETPGLIDDQGVFLANTSLWYPLFPNQRLSFTLSVELPAGWRAVSQGERSEVVFDDEVSRVRWAESAPQEELYLIAARFYEFIKPAGAVEAMAFLREDDPALAQKYLGVTAQYIDMYRQLIGPYPYSKFALVENFWETGYGMPSFTLLGPKVIRLPFILHSSYPHEILHNWWGNGVYVDFPQGNWSEGLTSYLADHLIKEQRGASALFRRNILQGYADFVGEGRDFALTDFRARHSASSEAVGYGKTQMLFHMLRRKLGDEQFIRGLHRFYMQHKFKVAAWSDVEQVFNQLDEQQFATFFQQWLTRVGAPKLAVRDVQREAVAGGWRLSGQLFQTQSGDAYELNVPLVISLVGEAQAATRVLHMSSKQQDFSLTLAAKPLRLDVDPGFDLFRRLHRAEIPPALSQAYGAEKALMLLPSVAPKALRDEYQRLAETWRLSQPFEVELKLDSEVAELPNDRAVWLLGWDNLHAATQLESAADFGVKSRAAGLLIDDKVISRDQSVVLTTRNPKADKQAIVWLAAGMPEAMPGLARKLPHYRKYSYLVFDGDEPSNVVKGQWPVLISPMSHVFSEQAAMAALPARQALAQLAPVFDEQRMMADVAALAAPEMAGRGLGGAGLDKAADYLLDAFKAAGLAPVRPGGGYSQPWTQYVDGLKRDVPMRNIIGIVPGHDPKLAGQSVVISAHYDHLGMGWPDVRHGNEGKLHPGADDNASGLAVLLELARMASHWQPARTIVFVAFTGEEAGRIGSQYYVRNFSAYPASQAIANVNLDTVGRVGDQPVTVFGTGSAREWVHIIRGIGFVSGIKLNSVASDFGASDQKSFLDAGIPAVQLFGGVHGDFHSPSDTIDKVEGASLVKMTAVAKELVDYLSSRPEPMNVTFDGARVKQISQQPVAGGRKVSLGTVPDFSDPGPGVLLTGVVAGSPAEKAGLQAGDRIEKVNQTTIDSLRSFAGVLRNLSVAESVQLTYRRAGRVQQVTATLEAR